MLICEIEKDRSEEVLVDWQSGEGAIQAEL
jgi:hypothetical protein